MLVALGCRDALQDEAVTCLLTGFDFLEFIKTADPAHIENCALLLGLYVLVFHELVNPIDEVARPNTHLLLLVRGFHGLNTLEQGHECEEGNNFVHFNFIDYKGLP